MTRNDSTFFTHYLRDASGNILAVYNDSSLIEQPIYGSSRLGQYLGHTSTGKRTLGHKNYELTNHLGNVLTVVTDNISMSTIDTIRATVASASDYYPFGLQMPGRTVSDTVGYRYGFNGKERDPASEWGQTSYDYGFRIYNPEVAKFLSVDPLTKDFPWYTPYQFAGNMPVAAIDLDGLEPKIVTSPRIFKGKIYSADEINKILQTRYSEIIHDNYIIKNKNTGIHEFDKERVSKIINNTVKERGWEAAKVQFKEFKSKADETFQKYDSWFFNGQAAEARLTKKQAIERYLAKRRFEYKLAEYNAIVEKGKFSAIVDISLGTGGVIISSVSIGTSFKSGGAEFPLAVAGLGFSLDQVVGGIEALNAINNGIFDPNKEYKIVRGMIIDVSGDAGGFVYDISSIIVGGSSSLKNINKISGKSLNEMVLLGTETTINTVNSTRTVDEYVND